MPYPTTTTNQESTAMTATAIASGRNCSGRNYRAMGDAKLIACANQLLDGCGDAYWRAVDKVGSRDVSGDIAVALHFVSDRGLTL